MNPTLKKLSSPNLSRFDIASLLERHIGEGSSQFHCEEAVAALRRIRHEETNVAVRIIARLLDTETDPCKTIRAVVANLRSTLSDEL